MVKQKFTGWAELTMEQYHSLKEAVNASNLKKILESPLEYKHSIEKTDKEEKSFFDMGHALHSTNLEQNTDSFIKGPDVNKNTTVWKDAKKEAEANGKILLDPSAYDDVLRGFEVFCSHPFAHKLVSYCQRIEQSGFYMDKKSGLWCKFRPDGVCANDTDGDYIFDYKSTRSLSQRTLETSIAEYGYHISAAHYIEGYKALTGRDIKHYYLCYQKSSGSMDVVVKLLDPDAIQLGKEIREAALLKIADCMAKNDWPGVSGKLEGIGLPQWAYDKAGEFLTSEAI